MRSVLRNALVLAPALALLFVLGCSESQPEPAPPRAQFDAPAGDVTAPPPALEIPEDAPTVLVMGDSIGAGLHLAEHQAFPAILQRRLFDAGVPFHLVNASVSGQTSAGGLSRYDWSLKVEPDVVVIELGGNDGLRGIELDSVERNLRGLIEQSQGAGARVLLLGVRMSPDLGDYAIEFDALYPHLAEETGAVLVPSFMDGVGGVPEMNLADGLHPTAAGHERLADRIESALRSVLEQR